MTNNWSIKDKEQFTWFGVAFYEASILKTLREKLLEDTNNFQDILLARLTSYLSFPLKSDRETMKTIEDILQIVNKLFREYKEKINYRFGMEDKMREIKFRVLGKKLYDKVIEISWAHNKIIHIVVWDDEIGRSKTLYPKDEPVLMQFTGLYDNTKWEELTKDEQEEWLKSGKTKEEWKGKAIYEGDIVKWKEKGYDMFDDDREYITVVKYSEELGGYLPFISIYKSLHYFDNYEKGALLSEMKDVAKEDGYFEFKVVGNIYENPELLKEVNR